MWKVIETEKKTEIALAFIPVPIFKKTVCGYFGVRTHVNFPTSAVLYKSGLQSH